MHYGSSSDIVKSYLAGQCYGLMKPSSLNMPFWNVLGTDQWHLQSLHQALPS